MNKRCPPRKASFLLRVLYELADVACPAMFALALLLIFVLRPVGVLGGSMEPTLRHGQRIVLLLAGELRRGDVVVVSDMGIELDSVIVKRVIGLPGDVIDIDFVAGVVYRNGEALDEDYVDAPTLLRGDVMFPVAVEEGRVFLLGDNRNGSEDSRMSSIGLVDRRFIIGRMIWPSE